jgi:hypothetical protein
MNISSSQDITSTGVICISIVYNVNALQTNVLLANPSLYQTRSPNDGNKYCSYNGGIQMINIPFIGRVDSFNLNTTISTVTCQSINHLCSLYVLFNTSTQSQNIRTVNIRPIATVTNTLYSCTNDGINAQPTNNSYFIDTSGNINVYITLLTLG